MKPSMRLPIVLAAISAVMAGCSSSSTERKDCVDAKGNKLPDSSCRNATGRVGMYPMWIYGGVASGSRIIGGTSTPSSTRSTNSSSSVRGGFGGSSVGG